MTDDDVRPVWLVRELERLGLLRAGWRTRWTRGEAHAILFEIADVFRDQAELAKLRRAQFFLVGFLAGAGAGVWLASLWGVR